VEKGIRNSEVQPASVSCVLTCQMPFHAVLYDRASVTMPSRRVPKEFVEK
jgi:hypothetical protein